MELPVLVVTVILLFLVEDGDSLQEFDEEGLYSCMCTIACDLREAIVFRRLVFKAGPGFLENTFGLFKNITKIPIKCEDSPEFWNGFPDYVCKETEEDRKKMFNEWITEIGLFWIETCNKNPTGEECSKTEDTAIELSAILAEYTAKGTCGSGATNKGQKQAEDIASKAPTNLKPPSFG